jgi:hypothetical protein
LGARRALEQDQDLDEPEHSIGDCRRGSDAQEDHFNSMAACGSIHAVGVLSGAATVCERAS